MQNAIRTPDLNAVIIHLGITCRRILCDAFDRNRDILGNIGDSVRTVLARGHYLSVRFHFRLGLIVSGIQCQGETERGTFVFPVCTRCRRGGGTFYAWQGDTVIGRLGSRFADREVVI